MGCLLGTKTKKVYWANQTLRDAFSAARRESLAGFKKTGRRRRGVGREDWYLAQGHGQGGFSFDLQLPRNYSPC